MAWHRIRPNTAAQFCHENNMAMRRYEELDNAAELLLRDMARIAKGEIKDPQRFAQESLLGAGMILSGPR